MKEPIETAEVVAGLRALADEFEAGYRPTPQPGAGLRRVNGSPLVPLVVHDALCGWRIASLQHDVPDIEALACSGCGLAYLAEEARGRP